MWLQVPTMQKLYFIRNRESMLKHAQTVFSLHQSGRRSWNIWWKTYTICWSLKSLRRWLCSHNRREVLHVVLVGWLAIQEVQLLRKHASSGYGSGVAQRRTSNKTEPVLLPKDAKGVFFVYKMRCQWSRFRKRALIYWLNSINKIGCFLVAYQLIEGLRNALSSLWFQKSACPTTPCCSTVPLPLLPRNPSSANMFRHIMTIYDILQRSLSRICGIYTINYHNNP